MVGTKGTAVASIGLGTLMPPLAPPDNLITGSLGLDVVTPFPGFSLLDFFSVEKESIERENRGSHATRKSAKTRAT